MAQTVPQDLAEDRIGPMQPSSAAPVAGQDAGLDAARNQLRDLNRDISHAQARLSQGQNDLITLQDQAQQLRADVAQAQQDLAEQTATATAETARLAEEARAARSEIEAMTRQLDDLQDKEVAQVERLLQLEADIEAAGTALEAERDAAQAQRATFQDEVAALTEQRDALRAETSRAETLAEQIRSQEEQSQALADQIGVLTAQLSALTQVFAQPMAQQAPAQDAEQTPITADIPPGIIAQNALDPITAEPPVAAPELRRSAAAVDAALALAPGLPAASGPRSRLRTMLIEGRCAPDALREVQSPINRQTLLVLMNRLERC